MDENFNQTIFVHNYDYLGGGHTNLYYGLATPLYTNSNDDNCEIYEFISQFWTEDTSDIFRAITLIDNQQGEIRLFDIFGFYRGLIGSDDYPYDDEITEEHKKMIFRIFPKTRNFTIKIHHDSFSVHAARMKAKISSLVELSVTHHLPPLVKDRIVSLNLPEWINTPITIRPNNNCYYTRLLHEIYDDCFRDLQMMNL